MATKKNAKKSEKILTPKEFAGVGVSYEMAEKEAKLAGKPTYLYTVGERVAVGALKDCIVDDICMDGKLYGIKHGADGSEYGYGYGYWAWPQVRPYGQAGDTHFSDNKLRSLNVSNRIVESLMYMHYHGGVDFDPDYQRGSVWSDDDREKLLDSIFAGREIGRFVFCDRDTSEWLKDGLMYEIIDGKQRLLTLLAFYENRFKYRGYYYNDLSPKDRNCFLNCITAVAKVRDVSRKEVLEIFLALNECGRPVSEDILDNVRELIKAEQKNQEEK